MLVSYEWLSEYVDLNGISPKDLAEKITRSEEHTSELQSRI